MPEWAEEHFARIQREMDNERRDRKKEVLRDFSYNSLLILQRTIAGAAIIGLCAFSVTSIIDSFTGVEDRIDEAKGELIAKHNEEISRFQSMESTLLDQQKSIEALAENLPGKMPLQEIKGTAQAILAINSKLHQASQEYQTLAKANRDLILQNAKLEDDNKKVKRERERADSLEKIASHRSQINLNQEKEINSLRLEINRLTELIVELKSRSIDGTMYADRTSFKPTEDELEKYFPNLSDRQTKWSW